MNKADLFRAVLGYCTEHHQPFWVIRTPPESTIGGFSCQFIAFGRDDTEVVIRQNNGEQQVVPFDQLTFYGQPDA